MRLIEGFVCTVRLTKPTKQELLFGSHTGRSEFNHERFTTNGLTPFSEEVDANQGLSGLRARTDIDFTQTGIAVVRMDLTESVDEWGRLRNGHSFIIVAELDYHDYLLLGRQVAGVAGVCYAPVSNLEQNGFRVIRDYDWLVGSLGPVHEVTRQGRPVSTQIASFEMQRVHL